MPTPASSCGRPAPLWMLAACVLFVAGLGALLGLIWCARLRAPAGHAGTRIFRAYHEGYADQEAKAGNAEAKAGNAGGARLVYLHLDGCPHCVEFTPRWKEFERTFSARMALAGVRIESHEARSEPAAPLRQYVTAGYPTVLFFPADAAKPPVTYDGPRTAAGLAAFVRAQGVQL
jgi:hypothetical protein